MDMSNYPAPVESQEDLRQREEQAANEERNAKIDSIQEALLAKRRKWIAWKQSRSIDERINNDLDVYYGRADPADAESTNAPKWFESRTVAQKRTASNRSRVRINATAAKTDAAVARVQEILFPIDDRNFAANATPVPDIDKMSNDETPVLNAPPRPNGDATRVKDIAAQFLEEANRKAKAMEDEIADQLDEFEYPRIGRSVIEMGGICGTGILKGPFTYVRKRRVSQMGIVNRGGQDVATIVVRQVDDLRPRSEEVDPRNFFPDPDCLGDIRKASGVFERRSISRKGLRELGDRPGYLRDRIAATLREQPKMTVTDPVREERDVRDFLLTENYEMWEYHGELDTQQIAALMGVSEAEVDPMQSVKVCIVMVNDRVIGAYEYIVKCEGTIYDVFNWKKDRGSIFGYGIVWAYRTQQRVINAAWRATMDQTGLSAGTNVVMKRDKISSADGDNTLGGRKLWLAENDVEDVRAAFAVFDINSKLKDFIALLEIAKQLGDEEINLPQIMQGFKGTAPDQVTSLLALLSKAEGVLRKVVKQYDDDVTKPHITRYHDYNMTWSEREDIKGDAFVSARGADELFMRDMRTQVTMLLANLSANPLFADWLKPKELLDQIARGGYLRAESVIKSKDEYDADMRARSQNQPQDPRIVAAGMQLQGKREEIADRQQQRAVDMQLHVNDQQVRAAELAYARQREQGEYLIEMTRIQNDRDTEFAKLANERNMSVAELLAHWKIATLEIDSKHQLFNAEAQLRRSTGEGI